MNTDLMFTVMDYTRSSQSIQGNFQTQNIKQRSTEKNVISQLLDCPITHFMNNNDKNLKS